VTFHSKYCNWDQNLQFSRQSETTSIPVTFIRDSTPRVYNTWWCVQTWWMESLLNGLSISDRRFRNTNRLYVVTMEGDGWRVSITKIENLFQPTPSEWFADLKETDYHLISKARWQWKSWKKVDKERNPTTAARNEGVVAGRGKAVCLCL